MKKFLLFFIILVSLMTFVLTRPKNATNSIAVSNEEIENYKQSLINSGYLKSEESINKAIDEYVELKTKIKESKRQGMPFAKALKTSLITSAIILGFLFIIYEFKNAQYNELFDPHVREINDDKIHTSRGLMRFFFGRWF